VIQELLPEPVNVVGRVEDVYEAVKYRRMSTLASLYINDAISVVLSE
jgi:hypothetical protein